MANHTEDRIWKAIAAMGTTGSAAIARAPQLRMIRQRKQTATPEALAQFLEALAPILAEQLADEAKVEEELSAIKSELAGFGGLLRRAHGARR